MQKNYETIIVGGGQAGLSTSYYLRKQNHDHVVLEQASRPGNVWGENRWESFTLVTPNWTFLLPGAEYMGTVPQGFMPRDEIVSCFEQYVEKYQLPILFQMRVNSVELNPDGQGYMVRTNGSVLTSENVVIASGLFQQPKTHSFQSFLSKDYFQLHSSQYRNPQSLPEGAVLVVGSGQSGCQIVDELHESGRKVYLCVGSAGRVPRKYRGKDVFEWLKLIGLLDKPVSKLLNPKDKFLANPHVSGRSGGKTLNIHKFSHEGVILLGRMQKAEGDFVWLAPDLKENLAKADKFENEILKLIDEYIMSSGLDVPNEVLPALRYGFDSPEIEELDLQSAGITTIIWATGYSFDFNVVHLPVMDSDGYPIQEKGVTTFPGLYFVGLPWLSRQKSGLLYGVGEDAKHIVSVITDN